MRSALLCRCCCPAPCLQYTNRPRCFDASESTAPCPGRPQIPVQCKQMPLVCLRERNRYSSCILGYMSARLVLTSWKSPRSIRSVAIGFCTSAIINVQVHINIGVWSIRDLRLRATGGTPIKHTGMPEKRKTSHLPARLLPEEVLEGLLGMQKVSRGI